jgi:hypothetical protein
MPARYNFPLNILTNRFPVLPSNADSIIRKVMNCIKASLDSLTDTINDTHDARFIQCTTGDDLDKHGIILALPRTPCESDDNYCQRLLATFRSIPTGLTVGELLQDVELITGETDSIDEYYKSAWLWPTNPEVSYDIFGKETVGASYASCVSDEKVACRFQVTDDGYLEVIRGYLAAAGSGSRTITGAIYSDNSGAPGALLADSDAIIVSAAGWYEFLFKGPTLTKNDYYWLAMNGTGGGWRFYYDSGETNQAAHNIDAPPPSDPFGTPTYESRDYSINGTYRIVHPDFVRKRVLNNFASKYYAAIIVNSFLLESQLDQIEEIIIDKKPAHVIIRIVEQGPGLYGLFREIL